MIYISTRDISNTVSSMEAIKNGISQEGGLFVPSYIPILSERQLAAMSLMDYAGRATVVLSEFLTDYLPQDIKSCTAYAYNAKTFDSPFIAPVVKLDESLYVQELWHGPTCAFKDLALQILPKLVTTAMGRTGENNSIAILVATSGDTGKAALEGFKDVPGTGIVVFYPENGVSAMQRLQMISQEGQNVQVVAVEGNFDDVQTGVKKIFADGNLNSAMKAGGWRFSSANSINWGRLVPQVVYYISAYLDMLNKGWIKDGESFNVVVPTGNFGNILAAFYARMMGLPIGKLICASNSNNVLADFINTGIYNTERKFYNTISPSMDILVSSNLERLLFELVDRDDKKVKSLMRALKENGEYAIDAHSLHKLKELFWGGFAGERQTMQTIRSTYNDTKYTLDPHTAVGKLVLEQYRHQTQDMRKALLSSTASPFKFAKDVIEAIAGEQATKDKDDFALLDALSGISGMPIPLPLAMLEGKKILHTNRSCVQGMGEVVGKIFKLI